MCCSMAPSSTSATKIYVGEALHPATRELVHVQSYGCSARSAGPNALLLAVPTRAPFRADNVIDGGKPLRRLMDVYATSVHSMMLGGMRGGDGFVAESMAAVFDKGPFTIVTSPSIGDINAAMSRVDPSRRPAIPQENLDVFGRAYPVDHQFVLACWSGVIDADPFAFWYEPNDPTQFFIPGLDAHDGGPVQIGAMVQTSHTLMVGSTIRKTHFGKGHYTTATSSRTADLGENRWAFPEVVAGTDTMDRVMINGDWKFATADLDKIQYPDIGTRYFKRTPPPGAAMFADWNAAAVEA